MADNDDLPDNVVAFEPRASGTQKTTDLLLEDCIGRFDEVVVLGFTDDGELEISGNVEGGAAAVYEAIAEAATQMALTHIDMVYQGTRH
jgi:hypothetical protein